MTFQSRVKKSIKQPITWIALSFWMIIIVIGLAQPDGFFLHEPTEGSVTFAYIVAGVTLGLAGKSFTVSCQSDHSDAMLSGNVYFALGLTLLGISLYYLGFALTLT